MGYLRMNVSPDKRPYDLQELKTRHPMMSFAGNVGRNCVHGRRGFSTLPPHTEMTMPALSPTMSSGNLIEWKVKEGQEVNVGDVLAEIETDKATLSWENQDEGYVAKLLVAEGTKGLEVGTPVLIMVEDEDQIVAFKDYKVEAKSTDPTPEATITSEQDRPSGSKPTPMAKTSSKIGPAARMLLQENGLTMADVRPSGPQGIITKGDVLKAIDGDRNKLTEEKQTVGVKTESLDSKASDSGAHLATSPEASKTKVQTTPSRETRQQEKGPEGNEYIDIPVTQIRRIIAQRLTESKSTIPHKYFSADIRIDALGPLREAMKSQSTKVSVNDCIIKAAALALAEIPSANAYWDKNKEQPMPSPSVDISIAVATDSGLITPIVRNADQKSLQSIAAEVRELATRARANKLMPEEFQGGSFSISNLGMFGVESFSAIINPPQSCILAVGGGRDAAVASDNGPKATKLMTATLSADGRIYDGNVASAFLDAFAKNLENPYRLFA